MKGRVLLIGGFKKAQALASSLIRQGYHVTAVNNDREHCRRLAETERLRVIIGDGTKPFVLEEAEADGMDVVVALTGRDEDNLVACQLCKKRFGVRKAVSLLADPRKESFFRELGVDATVNATSAVTAIIEQEALLDEMETLSAVAGGRLRVAQAPIGEEAWAAGRKVKELTLPKQVIIGCILRGEKALIPRGETRILAGDTLVLISSEGHEAEAIEGLMTGRGE